jgi:nucleotide-binding universal stress UspA family protein
VPNVQTYSLSHRLKGASFIALKKAVQIAHQFNSKVTILNVHPEFMGRQDREMLRVSFDGLKEKYRRVALESREEMKTEISKLHAEDIQVDYELREGKLETVVVETAERLGIDLIVICTDGRENIMDFVTGTITEHVINRTSCPVLVILYLKRS